MSTDPTELVESRRQDFLKQQHEKGLNKTTMEADSRAAEIIAEKIAANFAVKIDEQNRNIFDIGVRYGRTTFVAYLALIIAATAALGQLFGPAQEWTIWQTVLDYWNSMKSWVGF